MEEQQGLTPPVPGSPRAPCRAVSLACAWVLPAARAEHSRWPVGILRSRCRPPWSSSTEIAGHRAGCDSLPAMGLNIYSAAVRRLDLATFTGDAWALDATLAVPDAAVPRLLASGQPVRWTVFGMSSGHDNATQVVDTTTSLSTCLIKISKTDRNQSLVRACGATSGTIVGHGVTEEDVADGDVFSVAVPAIVVGTAPWLWIVPTSGFTVLGSGVSP